MSDQLEGRGRAAGGNPDHRAQLGSAECDRLEEIGDLHNQASAFSSALDYYRRLLDHDLLLRLPLQRRLEILRKSADAALNLGDLALADTLIGRAGALLQGTDDIPSEERARLLAPLMGRRAVSLSLRGEYTEALQIAKHAFAILAVTDAHREVGNLQVTMGACHQRLGRFDKAEEFYSDALATYRRVDDEVGAAGVYSNLALLHKNACRWGKALELLERAVGIAQRHGATHLLSRLQLNHGIILVKIGRLSEARAELEKCLRLARSLGDRNRQAKACLAFGMLELQSGRLARAEELILEGRQLAEQERFLREATIADEYLGDIHLLRGETDKAIFNYALGLERVRGLGKVTDLEGELLRRLAEAERQRGDLASAVETAAAALAACDKSGELFEIGFAHRTLGWAHAGGDNWAAADRHFRRSIQVFRQQHLPRHWIESTLAYLEARLATAGQPELLFLRRYLLEALELNGEEAASDRLLCRIQHGLAEVQLQLGQYEDALLTVYELERNAAGLLDAALTVAITDLRSRIERGLLGDIENNDNHLHAISSIPGIFSWNDNSIPRNLASVLKAGMERVQADHGFIAIEWGGAVVEPVRVVARTGLSENLAAQLARWYRAHAPGGDPLSPCLLTRLTPQDPLLRAVPALAGQASGCLFLPIAMHGKRFGMLFLGVHDHQKVDGAFGRPALDFLATYMGFLALFLFEKGRGRLPGEAPRPPTPLEGAPSFENIITENEAMLDVLGLLRKVAPSDLTVLLCGETGTGKGLLAYAIHALSRRANKKFLAINCAAIPESLLESELFGHVKGSFTGAISDKRGLLAEAEGGTVFLDEIAKMPLSMQGKLLHFLDTKVIRQVGSNQDRRVDVRIVCASKSDLRLSAEQGLFLEDLYFRLLDFPLMVPPLRARPDDIPLLAHHFLERFAQEMGQAPPGYTAAFMDALVHHSWPGNVRELEKDLRRAIVLAAGERVLRPEHLPAEVAARAASPAGAGPIAPLRDSIAALECREITQALRLAGGNKSAAARLLGISYPSLLKKIRFYGISPS